MPPARYARRVPRRVLPTACSSPARCVTTITRSSATTTTWRLAVSVPLSELAIRPHASVGTAVKLPTMFEQFGIDLGFRSQSRSETRKSLRLGCRYRVHPVERPHLPRCHLFPRRPDRQIDDRLHTIRNLRSLGNLDGTSMREGVEIGAQDKLVPRICCSGADYTFLNASDPNGQEEVRRPPIAAPTLPTFRRWPRHAQSCRHLQRDVKDRNFAFLSCFAQ